MSSKYISRFHFTIRDLLWLMVVVAIALAWFATAHRSALVEARMQSAERQLADCNLENVDLTDRDKQNSDFTEALVVTFRRLDMTEDQRTKWRELFQEELDNRGIKTVIVK